MSGRDFKFNRRSSGAHDVYLIVLVGVLSSLAEDATRKEDHFWIIINNDEVKVLILTCSFLVRVWRSGNDGLVKSRRRSGTRLGAEDGQGAPGCRVSAGAAMRRPVIVSRSPREARHNGHEDWSSLPWIPCRILRGNGNWRVGSNPRALTMDRVDGARFSTTTSPVGGELQP